MVPKVYLQSTSSPLSLNWALLVPQVYKISKIGPSVSLTAYMANGAMTCQILSYVVSNLIWKSQDSKSDIKKIY